MTYVEFFDKNSVENICSCLTDTPDRVIFVGASRDAIEAHIKNCERVFTGRGQSIEFICKTAPKNKLDKAVSLLEEIVSTYDDIVFDVTGGEKIYALALGIVYEKHKDKNIQIHFINVNNNVVNDCDADGKTVYKNLPSLSVVENIRIYGGDVVYGDVNAENATYRFDLTSEFCDDLETMWSICKQNPKEWNFQTTIFDAVCKVGKSFAGGLYVVANVSNVKKYLSRNGLRYEIKQRVIDALVKNDLLSEYVCDGETVELTFKDEQVKKCITKAGQALEMRVYLAAKSLKDKKANAVFSDAETGVVIDWDGKFHDEKSENKVDTENEIDVMLMQGIVPVFISCKNGKVSVDELYKLNTVAERFGGKYAKKILAVTDLSMSGDAGNYVSQRAADMNIKVINGIKDMSDKELCNEIFISCGV